MTEHDLSSPPQGCGNDVAAYALGALDPSEVEAFQAHLEACAICRDELAAFQQVVDVLALSAPTYQAPKRLRRSVMAAVAAEANAAQPARQPASAETSRRPRWRPWATLSLATAAAAVLAVVLVLPGPSSSGTRTIAAQVSGVSGRAELRISGGHAELIVRDFSPPPPGRIYEVWEQRPGQPPSPTSALFSVTRRGAGDVAVPGELHGVRLIMVTPEPAGGSRVPTAAPVIRAQLS